MVHIVGSISGPHHFSLSLNKNRGFRGFFEPSFQRGVQSFRLFVFFLVQKQARKRWQKLGFSFFCSGACCFMLLLEYKKGGGKNTLQNQVSFATPFLREGKGRKEERGQRSKKTSPLFHRKVWGLKNGQEVVPPFWAPKFQFSKSAKTLFYRDFQEKLVVHNVWGKGYARKRAKTITVLGFFEFDAFLSCVFWVS